MKYHVHIDTEQAVRHPEPFVGFILVDGKRLNSKDEVRLFMNNQLAQGHKLLPCGECDNFDYEKGCQGHPERREKTQ